MAKKISKYKAARNKLLAESKLLNYLLENPNQKFSKFHLMGITGHSERDTRRELSKIADFYPIVADSATKGYKILSLENPTPESVEEAQHELNELQSRITELKARMKPLIAYLYDADAIIKAKEGVTNENKQPKD